MHLRPEQLGGHLQRELASVYVVTGDEPLQSGEACDAIRTAAREQGYTTREILDASGNFDWNRLAAEAGALSLFAERKVIDLRIPGGKPGREGGAALAAYCTDPPPDTLLLVSLPKLDRNQQNGKWYKALLNSGVVVQVWPVDHKQLPNWIRQRMQAAGLNPEREAVQVLADRVEGNLLAAHQEIEKLQILFGGGDISTAQMLDAVSDSARYDVFELVDAALQGEAQRALHILDGLRGEGIAAPVVLWALHRETELLATLSADIAQGTGPDHAMSRARVWDRRKPLLNAALQRLRTPRLLGLLSRCQEADAAIKGGRKDPWLLFERITLTLAGTAGFA